MKFFTLSLLLCCFPLTALASNVQTLTITTTQSNTLVASTDQGFVSTATFCNTGTNTVYMELDNVPNGANAPSVVVTINSYPILAGACVTFSSLYGDTYFAALSANNTSTITITNATVSNSRQLMMLANGADAVLPDARNAILGLNFSIDNSGNFYAHGSGMIAGSLQLTSMGTALTINNGNVDFDNNLTVGGTIIANNLDLSGTLSLTNLSLPGTLTLTNTGSNILTVDGQSIFNKGIQITDSNPSVSVFNGKYYSTWSNQYAASALNTNFTGTVSDSSGSFLSNLYVALSDSDGSVYNQDHTDNAAQFGIFGPFTSGSYIPTYKNLVALSAYGLADSSGTILSGTGYMPGLSGISSEIWQYGGGIADNEFAVHNPSSANGGKAQSGSIAALQGIVDNSFAASDDTTHFAYAFLATNEGTQPITAAFAANGSTAYHVFLDGYNTLVSEFGIIMPGTAAGSSSTFNGTVINYGANYGNPAGGSYSAWNPYAEGGTFQWVDSGNSVAQLSAGAGLMLYDATYLLGTNVALTDYQSTNTATLTNAPKAGNPTKWIAINDNNTLRYIPTW